MSFIKLTGERGQTIYVKPVWVHAIERVVMRSPQQLEWSAGPMSIVYVIGGDEILVMGDPDDVIAALYPPTEPTRTTVRKVGVV